LCLCDLILQERDLTVHRQRAQCDFGVHWVANNSPFLNRLNQFLFELIVDFGLNDEAFSIDAGLAIRAHSAPVGGIYSLIHVAVTKSEEGIVASQFKCSFAQIFAAK